MKIAVLTDTTASLPVQVREEYNIYTIPLNVVFGHTSYEEEVELSVDDFKQKLVETDILPKTSQPSIGRFVELFEELKQSYDAVISIHLSSKISGTYRTALSAAKMVPELDVHVFDTEISAMMQGFYAIEAAKMIQEGAQLEAILERLESIRESSDAYFMVDDLNHLQRGGRLSKGSAIIGSLLQIKPILHFENKEIVLFEKVRTRKRAARRIIDLVKEASEREQLTKIVIIHSEHEAFAASLEEQIEKEVPNVPILHSSFSPVLLTHLGVGSIGVGWYV